MAEKRMFSRDVIDSDMFLDLPSSAQALYFHLAMRADDDGFVNSPKMIRRMVGASDDDVRILCAKAFLIPFESGVVVIKHWRIHNYIQKDRYKPTVYADEKAQLRLKDNKAYSLTEGSLLGTEQPVNPTQQYTNWKTATRARAAVAGKLVEQMILDGRACAVLGNLHDWLVKAMELILGEHEADSKVIRIFSKTLSDLAEGELLQLQKAQSGDTTEEDYTRIIYNKTASLFEASCVSAALSVGASDQTVDAMRSYAVALGRAFQIKDDILDYDGTESVGKPLGVDILEQKMTMPLLGALVNAGPQEDMRIRALVRDIVGHPEHRDEIVAFVKTNGGMEYASERLDFYVNQAVDALAVLSESFEKELLVKLARYTASREK